MWVSTRRARPRDRVARMAEQSPALDGVRDRDGDHLLPQEIVVLDLLQHISRKNVEDVRIEPDYAFDVATIEKVRIEVCKVVGNPYIFRGDEDIRRERLD